MTPTSADVEHARAPGVGTLRRLGTNDRHALDGTSERIGKRRGGLRVEWCGCAGWEEGSGDQEEAHSLDGKHVTSTCIERASTGTTNAIAHAMRCREIESFAKRTMSRAARKFSYVVVVMSGCQRTDPTAVSDAAMTVSSAPAMASVVLGPIVATTASASTTTTVKAPTLAPLELAGTVPAHEVKPVTTTSAATSGSQPQLRACCDELRKQSQQLTLEAAQLAQAAAVCDSVVAAMGTATPQLAPLKPLLGVITLPPICEGL